MSSVKIHFLGQMCAQDDNDSRFFEKYVHKRPVLCLEMNNPFITNSDLLQEVFY